MCCLETEFAALKKKKALNIIRAKQLQDQQKEKKNP